MVNFGLNCLVGRRVLHKATEGVFFFLQFSTQIKFENISKINIPFYQNKNTI